MRARKPGWYSLRKMKIRQSWNKHNLFNLVRKTLKPSRFNRTFFQQKWVAKSDTRSYHGANIKESDWSRMFSRRLYSAVDMPPQYLAKYDGSEQAAGRGSGRDRDPSSNEPEISASNFSAYEQRLKSALRSNENGEPRRKFHVGQPPSFADSRGKLIGEPVRQLTPYMQMAFAPLERRLDVAVFRAMFASSTLQAKQFCTHGAVKVNGKTMRYGAYLLNPGDMFQVDVDAVLYATGRPKTPNHAQFLAGEDWDTKYGRGEWAPRGGRGAVQESEASEETSAKTTEGQETTETAEDGAEAAGEGGDENVNLEGLTEEQRVAAHRKHLKTLVRSAKDLINDGQNLNPRKKRQLRSFMSEAKRAISQAGRASEESPVQHDNVIDHLSALLKDFKLDGTQVEAVASAEKQAEENQSSVKEKAATKTLTDMVSSKKVREEIEGLSKAEQQAFERLLRQDAENPIDESKPYWTPWEPRRWIAPFAFIPRYLEVNQNICAAVYLRHPVARRGLAEVPTPFPYETNQLAFNWYLRRR